MGKKLFFILFHHKHYFSALNCKLKIVAKKGKWLPNQILAKPSLELECRALTGAAPFSSLLCLIKYIYLSRYLQHTSYFDLNSVKLHTDLKPQARICLSLTSHKKLDGTS